MKKAELELNKEFKINRYLPVFISFVKGIFVNRQLNKNHFRYWMISKILNSFRNSLLEKGIITSANNPFEMLFKTDTSNYNSLDKFIDILEETWNKDISLDFNKIVDILGIEERNFKFVDETDSVKALVEQFCKQYNIQKVVLFFDEACHNFIPEQQREFFSMIRDLRSPYICCKAAIYPGITYYGILQKFHDVVIRRVERDVFDKNYISNMREIIQKQCTDGFFMKFEEKGMELDAFIICSCGNPRLLLKSIEQASQNFKSLKKADVNESIIDFYRVRIWNEHVKLANTYAGHKELIEWSRLFIENSVIPERVKNAIRILEYTGIIQLHTEGTKIKRNIYDRYQINFGVVIASEQSKSSVDRCNELYRGLSIKYYTEFGATSPAFKSLMDNPLVNDNFENINLALEVILNKSIKLLDITDKQKNNLKEVGIITIHDILTKKIDDLMKARQIGPIRSKNIYDCAYNAAVEYISG